MLQIVILGSELAYLYIHERLSYDATWHVTLRLTFALVLALALALTSVPTPSLTFSSFSLFFLLTNR